MYILFLYIERRLEFEVYRLSRLLVYYREPEKRSEILAGIDRRKRQGVLIARYLERGGYCSFLD